LIFTISIIVKFQRKYVIDENLSIIGEVRQHMIKKEMIAMLLAGGQGSRLGVLTDKVAKPAVAFGGKYRIIDFPLSNCINSGIDTVGVLTQYQPLRLNSHIGIGIPWDLDKGEGGVTLLSPYESNYGNGWYSGTADAIYQNITFMDKYDPDYVVILSGDHIYKMDYQLMLDYHKANKADLTIACMTVPWEEASRFGIMITDEFGKITEFEEKPENPRSNLASMGIYIFSYDVLKKTLKKLKDVPNLDFGMHVLPDIRENNGRIYAYEFSGYWKDVGTLGSYWSANMELIDIVPEFNLYEEFWKIYTNCQTINPTYISDTSKIERTIISSGCEIYGEVVNSVLGFDITVGKGTVIKDSIIMNGVTIGENCHIEKAIIAEDTKIGDRVTLGAGEEVPNVVKPKIYGDGICTIGENSYIPDDITIGKNTAVYGKTNVSDYFDKQLPSGGYLKKEGE
jgi:glucose-1-phosphate adenylyltransferase